MPGDFPFLKAAEEDRKRDGSDWLYSRLIEINVLLSRHAVRGNEALAAFSDEYISINAF